MRISERGSDRPVFQWRMRAGAQARRRAAGRSAARGAGEEPVGGEKGRRVGVAGGVERQGSKIHTGRVLIDVTGKPFKRGGVRGVEIVGEVRGGVFEGGEVGRLAVRRFHCEWEGERLDG